MGKVYLQSFWSRGKLSLELAHALSEKTNERKKDRKKGLQKKGLQKKGHTLFRARSRQTITDGSEGFWLTTKRTIMAPRYLTISIKAQFPTTASSNSLSHRKINKVSVVFELYRFLAQTLTPFEFRRPFLCKRPHRFL